jgi:hypothetical protein
VDHIETIDGTLSYSTMIPAESPHALILNVELLGLKVKTPSQAAAADRHPPTLEKLRTLALEQIRLDAVTHGLHAYVPVHFDR